VVGGKSDFTVRVHVRRGRPLGLLRDGGGLSFLLHVEHGNGPVQQPIWQRGRTSGDNVS